MSEVRLFPRGSHLAVRAAAGVWLCRARAPVTLHQDTFPAAWLEREGPAAGLFRRRTVISSRPSTVSLLDGWN